MTDPTPKAIETTARIIYEAWWHEIEGFDGDPYSGSCAELWIKWIPVARRLCLARPGGAGDVMGGDMND